MSGSLRAFAISSIQLTINGMWNCMKHKFELISYRLKWSSKQRHLSLNRLYAFFYDLFHKKVTWIFGLLVFVLLPTHDEIRICWHWDLIWKWMNLSQFFLCFILLFIGDFWHIFPILIRIFFGFRFKICVNIFRFEVSLLLFDAQFANKRKPI